MDHFETGREPYPLPLFELSSYACSELCALYITYIHDAGLAWRSSTTSKYEYETV